MRSPLLVDYAAQEAAMHRTKRGGINRMGRILLLAGAACVWVGLVIARLVSLQISDVERWQEWALKQHFSEITIASERGNIIDRNGRLMAVSVPAGSIYARPRQIKNRQEAAKKLAEIIGENPKEIEEKLNSSSPFVWIKRQMPRHVAEKVEAEKIAGLGKVIESRRFYPYNEGASTLIGRVGIDGNGLSGLESIYEKTLRGNQRKARVNRDALGHYIQTSESHDMVLPSGEQLQLTLDADLQMIVDEELEAGRNDAKAKGAMAVLADADTGEILAMSQSPSVNFNLSKIPSARALRNQIIETVFEPGSTMKPIVAAGAIEAGLVKSTDMLNCEGGRYRVGKHTIKDVHPSGIISAFDVVVRSSNIGMTKMGMRMGADRLYNFLRHAGFGDPSGLGLPGETRGILRSVNGWAPIDVATHSFGQGVAVTPLQMVRAVSAIANGGTLPNLTLVKDSSVQRPGKRIFSERTSEVVREMMFGVVENEHGTGHNAQIEGVRIGGKTGTAQKARADGKGYAQGLYVASFVGFAEASALGLKRRLTLFVMVDEPNAKSIYGGTLAAPVFKRVMQRVLHYLSTARNQQGSPDIVEPAPPTHGAVALTNVAYRPS